MSRRILPALALSLALAAAGAAASQTLEPDLRDSTVRRVAEMVRDLEADTEAGRLMSERILELHAQGAYDGLDDPQAFADRLVADMTAVADDGHLRLEYDPERAAELLGRTRPTPEERRENLERERAWERPRNFGFREVKILPGNVGYLRLDSFANSAIGSETAVAAMNLLGNADHVIVDLRRNGGGSPTMAQLLMSYFYDDDDEVFVEIEAPGLGQLTQYRSLPFLPGTRLVDAGLWVLTGPRTFSAAEGFAYCLQAKGRATVVGETTRGGAGVTGGPRAVNEHFLISLAVARVTQPDTGGNWEGTGVTPDVAVPADAALAEAHGRILDAVASRAQDPGTLNRLGYELLGERMLDTALRVFERNVELHPGYANGHDSLGEAYLLAGRKDEARASYRRALELEPGMESARRALEEIE